MCITSLSERTFVSVGRALVLGLCRAELHSYEPLWLFITTVITFSCKSLLSYYVNLYFVQAIGQWRREE